MLGVSVYLSPRSYYNLWGSPWINLCPKWSSGAFGIRISISLSDHNPFKSVFLKSIKQYKICGALEEVANMRSVPIWISYLLANSWIFSTFLAILINFIKSKTDLNFPKF
jgi:hypothetical protein